MLRRRHEQREQRRADRPRTGNTRYRMRQRLMSIGDDFTIENDSGEPVLKVDGKALRLRKTLVLEDMAGHRLYKIQKRVARVRDSMEIEGPDGERVALVQKALITPLRNRWTVKVEGGPELQVKGNVVDHEYHVNRGGDRIAEVTKRWFKVADTYSVEIRSGENDVLILATIAAVDAMAHEGR